MRNILRAIAGAGWTGMGAAALLVMLAAGCASPPQQQPAEAAGPRHQYKEIKPEEYPVPEAVAKALPGLLDDKVRIYREISPIISLVVYTPDYSRAKAVDMCARAFVALAEKPEFRKGIDFWIVQVQPEPETNDPALVVWGVKPSEVDRYIKTKDLAAFLEKSEYLLVDDEIIPAGEKRLEAAPEVKPPAPAPEPEPAPEPAPEPEEPRHIPVPGSTAP